MKKVDKLVLSSFWGAFLVTLSVVVFIFLMRIIIFHIKDFVSKDITLLDYSSLFFYFAISTIPIALPLAMLLSCLMAFGNLGEFFELTALKSAGISTSRAMLPLGVVAVLISIFSFVFNDRVVPWANLNGYRLLYDITHSKATLKIKEGIFYTDLPGHSIKVDKKYPDGVSMKGMVIYKNDPRAYERGNTEVILADSGRMYSINNNGYLTIELFNGVHYQEMYSGSTQPNYTMASAYQVTPSFARNQFKHYKLVVSLESFNMNKTDKEQFKYHEYMKNSEELNYVTDSLRKDFAVTKTNLVPSSHQFYTYQFKIGANYLKRLEPGTWADSLLALPVSDSLKSMLLTNAQNAVISTKSFAQTNSDYLINKAKEGNRYELEKHHKYTQAIACLMMFLIGAPLGGIIKKGGFGVPVLVSILFFILYYVLTIQGDKWVKEDLVSVELGAWLANTVLLIFGLYFTQRAQTDSRLFEKDNYQIIFDRLKVALLKRFPWLNRLKISYPFGPTSRV